MNVFQEEDTIVIERAIPAPGLDELETELVEKRLEVRAMLREDVDSDAPDHRERPVNSGSFTVMVNLPQQLERTMVNLDVEEGWLVIRMPRTGQIDRETVEVICDLE